MLYDAIHRCPSYKNHTRQSLVLCCSHSFLEVCLDSRNGEERFLCLLTRYLLLVLPISIATDVLIHGWMAFNCPTTEHARYTADVRIIRHHFVLMGITAPRTHAMEMPILNSCA